MDDKQIIELYFERNEQAIKETDVKYGAFCHRIAMNILGIHEDAEECINDTYYSVWKQIPPTVPEVFKVYMLSSYPLSMTKVALPNSCRPLSMAEKVTSLMEVKSFSLEEWIFEKMLTG